MQNISGYGTLIQLVASITFPVGFLINAFSDDTDAIDVPSVQVADSTMGLNGDLIVWSKANPIKATITVIPDSNEDINLGILLENNRPGKGKLVVQDTILLSTIFPDGSQLTLINGIITDGMPTNSVASSGRLKTKTYAFAFENRTFV
jgi:hypothetical protein